MAEEIDVSGADGANVGVGNPRAAPSNSSSGNAHSADVMIIGRHATHGPPHVGRVGMMVVTTTLDIMITVTMKMAVVAVKIVVLIRVVEG